jgi:hypothetical protein
MELGFDDIARIWAFGAKALGAGAGLVLLAVLRREGGPRPLLLAWLIVVAETLILFGPTVYLEALSVGQDLRPDLAPQLQALRTRSYTVFYLVLSCLGALVPAAVLVALARTRGGRGLGLVLCALALLLGLGLALGGVPADWQSFVNLNRLLSGLRGVSYLILWVALFLGRLHPVDPFLPVFLGVMTSFSLLLPLQETVFALFELGAGQEFWAVNQALQAVHYTVLTVVCWTLARRVARGVPPDLLVVGEDRRTPWRVASLAA